MGQAWPVYPISGWMERHKQTCLCLQQNTRQLDWPVVIIENVLQSVEAGVPEQPMPGKPPSLKAHQATEPGAMGSRPFTAARIELLQEWPGRETLPILKMKAPCPIRTGQGVYPCLTGYTKVSLKKPVAAETLQPVDGHMWPLCS